MAYYKSFTGNAIWLAFGLLATKKHIQHHDKKNSVHKNHKTIVNSLKPRLKYMHNLLQH
jgi:hypothetical protein